MKRTIRATSASLLLGLLACIAILPDRGAFAMPPDGEQQTIAIENVTVVTRQHRR